MNKYSAVAGAVLFCIGSFQADATTLYSTGNDGKDLYTIDSITGNGTHIGAFGHSGTYALAFDSHNTLYALVNGFSSGGLATVNVATGAATTIGSGTNISNLMALAFGSNGTLYAASWSTNSLYTINTSTGSASLVGALGFGGIMDLAFDSHGTLYGVSNGLYTINTTTGAGTQVAASAGSGCLMAMTIEGGNGFATDYCTGSSPLYHLDLTNGSVTSIGNTGISNPMALTYMGAAGAVPEPASWALMLVGFAGIGVAARRRQHVAVTFG